MPNQITEEHVNIASNVSNSLTHFWPLLFDYGIPLIGFCMFVSGFILIAKEAGPRSQGSLFAGVGSMIAGLVMLNLKASLHLLGYSLLGDSSVETMLSYSGGSSGSPTDVFVVVSFQIIQLVGLVAFAQGAWLLKKAAANPQISWFKAITHIIGGFIAINHKTFLEVLANTLGGGVGESINSFINMGY